MGFVLRSGALAAALRALAERMHPLLVVGLPAVDSADPLPKRAASQTGREEGGGGREP